MIEGVQTRLMEAIKVRLRADVPLGIYLSGGIDSSAVAGMVAHLVKEEGARLGNDDSHLLSRIKCFTVQFDKESGADESGMLSPRFSGLLNLKANYW
jgi:asparagine synthase (glutamine-hydrolysing)